MSSVQNTTDKNATNNRRNENFRSFLAKWRTENNITDSAMDALLLEVRKHGHPTLPKCSKTLLNTSQQAKHFEKIGDGIYVHIGLKINLNAYCLALKTNKFPIPQKIVLDFNMDGVNYSKSTNCSLWLIQASFRNTEWDPCVIGCYYGKTKPKCNDFLKCFVEEIKELIMNGFSFGHDVVNIELGTICNDTPANSYVRASKGHAGYYSCVKCVQKGLNLDRCMIFPYIKSPLRTDYDFRERTQPEHHVGDSIIENIPTIDMVKSFCIDEMHVVHLGVVKKLIKMWVDTSEKSQRVSFERNISRIEEYRPKEIHRTIRNLTYFNQYKAKEFRTFLLFTGPAILLNLLDKKKYEHFMLLHVAMKKLGQKDCSNSVQLLLEKFVSDFKKIYNLNKITYVVHSLIHLCDDVKQNGSLQSAYKFENNSGKIARTIKHGTNVAQQINNRALERLKVISLPIKEPLIFGKKFKCQTKKETYFKQITINGIRIDCTKRNRCFLTKNKEIYSFNYATSDDKISCKKIDSFSNESFYKNPIDSVDFDIFFIEKITLSAEEKLIDITYIYAKMFVIPLERGYALFPIHI